MAPQSGYGIAVVSRRKARSGLSSMSSFHWEASSELMFFQLWFGYMLILSWAVISNASGRSLSSLSTTGYEHENVPTPIHSPSIHPAVTPVNSPLPLHKFHHSTAQSPSSSHVPHGKNLMAHHVNLRFSGPLLSLKSWPVKVDSHASGSLTTLSGYGRRLSAPVSDILKPPAGGVAPPPSIFTSIASNSTPPSLSPHVGDCCKSIMISRPGSHNCSCVYPIKLQLLILNLSTSNTNWSAEFQQELASQLGLSVVQFVISYFHIDNTNELNMSMDIAPLYGLSFSYSEAHQINYTLVRHKLHLNSSLYGDYRLLNFTWFEKPVIPPVSRPANPIQNEGSVMRPSSTRCFAYEELKEATNNFETASVLGEGGFGRVFKGVLKDGTLVAIKKLSSGGQQGDREFLVEVEMLSRLHHRNLVKLIGYYSNHDSSQHLLCYELVPNGSLEAWLHGPFGENRPLDWDIRMKIALDAARGLAYLHEDSQPCVIHRDFKASNILLENNFHAKVADFGLAKQAPEGRANYLSTRVMGTFGYVAPEYAMTGHLLVKSDVYSYGVVLLELLSGRKPVDMSQPSGQENLVTWARPILRDKDRLEELVDRRLGGKYPKEDFVRVCAIAAACVAPEANQRPTMGEVVQSLKMVQHTGESHQTGERDGFADTLKNSNNPHTSSGRNARLVSTTFESDVSSSIFSSGPFSGLSGIDNDNISRTAVFSEDLQEGR
ncbi:probable L-type lectin-domain containing receptor kinase I.5 isoform X4 [Cryptomeria japonica]|uniref:probable L-type lectin-domain containing receptor kinase I.5 isoform X4 n=1 Tax=Cryptomeria japonica TaxID=3369 RepID=UPI0025AC7AD0|nr:probable L-type lectin-domain containing receptor kinase I.5 isoform X4 [Cryptomeria japonica]